MSTTPNPNPTEWTVTAWALYDQGDRATQEDRHDIKVLPGKMRFVIVADGAGGPPAGEDAAEIGITVIGHNCRATDHPPGTPATVVRQFMEGLFVAADQEIKQEGVTYPEKKGLGAACVMMLEVAPDLHFLGAGDARAYAFDPQNRRLTRMTYDQAGSQPGSITSALGWLDTMSYQTKPVNQLFPGDLGVLVLSSDGLTKLLSDNEIADILKQGGTAQVICERLMAKAKATGRRRDNITIVVLVYVRTRK